LVHSLRDWLTRKQRETRRGRAELRLAERAMLWDDKPENRRLPSVFEWATIRMLTRKKDWSAPQRRMMRRSARVHGLRGLVLAILIGLVTWGSIEAYGDLRATALVDSLRTANITDVPARIEQLRSYRRWAGRPLLGLLASTENDRDPHLRASLASLALGPDDGRQADYLFDQLLRASPIELSVIWSILQKHDPAIEHRLRSVRDDARANSEQRFRAACALARADSAPGEKSWDGVAPFIADQFLSTVIRNPSDYATLIETLRPVRKRLLAPLARVFRDANRSESERTFATTILADYADDDPGLVADLLMDAGPKAFASLFPVAKRQEARMLPLIRAEMVKEAEPNWNDPPLDQSWTQPDPALKGRIDSAQGLLDDRFAFCQTMPLDEFLTVAEGLRKSGYRPMQVRPFDNSDGVCVAAIWVRDGGDWVMKCCETVEEADRDVRDLLAKRWSPVDLAGYVTRSIDRSPRACYTVVGMKSPTRAEDLSCRVGTDESKLQSEFEGLARGGSSRGRSNRTAVPTGPEDTASYGIAVRRVSFKGRAGWRAI
jgi:hypothetical protein